MTVEMGIRHRATGTYEVVPIATTNGFREIWLPACEHLGLKLVPLFSGGGLTVVPPELIPGIIAELEKLRGWAAEQPASQGLVERCAGILAALNRADSTMCEYDFG